MNKYRSPHPALAHDGPKVLECDTQIYPSRVADSACGKSLIATADVPAGVVVARFEGPLVPAADVPESEICHALWLDGDNWIVPTSSARYANHSCDPNCRVNDDLEVFTIRPVRADEELTFSYNTVRAGEGDPPAWDPRWSFRCLCGSPQCQHRVDGWVYE